MKTANTSNLYLVVRPRQNPEQTFRNEWLDDDRLESIETSIEIGEQCKEAMTTDVGKCHRIFEAVNELIPARIC